LTYLSQQQCGSCRPIEQAWVISTLIDEGMTQAAIALRMGRDKSWISRRLSLVSELPDDIQQAIRSDEVSTWVAGRVFKPLARANAAHAKTLLNTLKKQPMSSRELTVWFDHYKNANQGQRTKMVEQPDLLLRVLRCKQDDKACIDLQSGLEGRWIHNVKTTKALIKQLMKPLPQMFSTQSVQTISLLEQNFTALDESYAQLKTQFQEVKNAHQRDSEHHSRAAFKANTDQADHAPPESIPQHSAPSDSPSKTRKAQTKEVGERYLKAARALLVDQGKCGSNSRNSE